MSETDAELIDRLHKGIRSRDALIAGLRKIIAERPVAPHPVDAANRLDDITGLRSAYEQGVEDSAVAAWNAWGEPQSFSPEFVAAAIRALKGEGR